MEGNIWDLHVAYELSCKTDGNRHLMRLSTIRPDLRIGPHMPVAWEMLIRNTSLIRSFVTCCTKVTESNMPIFVLVSGYVC